MKTKKSKFLLPIVLVLLIIFSISYVYENDIKSFSIQDNFEVYNISPVESTEFQSEDLTAGEKTAFVYATLSNKTASNNKDEYIITIGRVKGINDNRYEIYSVEPQLDKNILSDEYINVFDYPQHEIKSGKSYYGSIYAGTVPIDCKCVEIQGVKAEMVKQSFELNGKKAEFYLYYCAIEEDEYPDFVSVVCEKSDGSKVNIVTEKY